MNPQYMNQQAAPPPTQGSFQNVPLGPPKHGGGPEPGGPMSFPPQPSQYAPPQPRMNPVPPGQRPPLSQLPPGQLPPSQRPPSMNGPPQFATQQNGADMPPRNISTGPPLPAPSPSNNQAPPNSRGYQPFNEQGGGGARVPPIPGQNIGSPSSGAQIPSVTSSGMPPMSRGHPPMPGQQQPPPMPGQPPIGGQSLPPMSGQPMGGQQVLPPMSGQQQVPPPMSGQQVPPAMPGQQSIGQPPSMSGKPPSIPGQQPPMPGQQPPMPGQQPPMPGQQPPMPGQQPPMPGQQPNMPGQQPSMLGQQPSMPGLQPPIPGQQPLMHGQQPSMPGQPPSLSELPSPFGQPAMSRPPMMSGPNLMSEPVPSMPGQPPLPGQPPMSGRPPMPNQSQLGGQSHGGVPPMSNQPQLGGPSLGGVPSMPHIGGQPSLQGRPPMPGQPQMVGQPPVQGRPPMPGQPPMSGHPPISSQPPLPQSQMGGPPMAGQKMPGQPPMPNLRPVMNQPPMPGQPPISNQPAPGQYNSYNQSRPPMPGQPQQFNQPPMPGMNQPPYQPGQYPQQQLPNQMQGMNISGPYAKAMNGDNGPHMPPPMNQQMQHNRPGYPPMPGQAPMAAPGQYPSPYQQQQQQKRLDPDQMPSPIQVIQDDQANRSGIFHANQKGLVPPLVTTKFVVQDQGFASPRYIRSTMYNVPITNDLMKQTSAPFGLVISPMAKTIEGEYAPPVCNFGELGPVRCIRCKAYMCPFMQFIDSGRKFQCLFCKASTDVPAEYFQHLDHTGQRMDRYERPELVLGTYEFTATTDYCRNNKTPREPALVFIIDVSYNNIKSGLVQLICSQMKEIIKNLPVDDNQEKSNMRVGFITYNSSVHFYNIKGNLAAPQMLVVGDTQEMFMPLLDGFLCTPEESDVVIDALMEQIPAMFADTRECETILMPAIVAGLEALKASECAGKLLVFHSSLPTAEAPGKLKNRDDRKLLGTDKERTVLTPQNQNYNQLGQDCVGSGCSVDLFLFNNSYVDIATIGQVARLTGGEVYKYTYFQADIDGDRVINDIITNISRPVAFDAIMRVRTSTGVRPTDFYGHMFMSNTTDMELASIDCDKAIAVEIKHDDKLQEDEGIYIQVALLYTSVSGQRRLRIINQALKTCSQMADLYRSCDLDTIMNFFSKQAVFKLLEHNPKAVKDGIMNRAAQMLANYRKNCASPSSAGQLILPECMKLLPLYVNCLLKSDAISGGPDMTLDDRSYVMQAVMTMDVPSSLSFFYPRLIPLHDIKPNGDDVEVPAMIRCSIEKMTENGVYILENGIHMFLWIGLGVNQEFIQQVFGVSSSVQVNIDTVALPELNNPLSETIRTVVEKVRAQRHRYMRLTLVRQKDKLESVFKHFLTEDRGVDNSAGYVDFLCHMHKEIRSLLS